MSKSFKMYVNLALLGFAVGRTYLTLKKRAAAPGRGAGRRWK